MDLRKFLTKRVFYPLYDLKNRSGLHAYLREFERSQYQSLEEIHRRQWQRLQKLLKHAYENTVFYRERFSALGMEPEDIRSPEDLLRIPPLSKPDIQEHLPDMLASGYDAEDLNRDCTGGSTGAPLVFYYDDKRLTIREASRIRHNRWAGWDIGDKLAVLWGSDRDRKVTSSFRWQVRNFLLRQDVPRLNTLSVTEEDLAHFARQLQRFQPKIIQSYANSLVLFARYVKENNLSGIHPQGIVSTAEVLFPKDRKFVEDVFGCPVFNRYGSRELGLMASECDRHEGLHINADCLWVEFVQEQRHAGENQLGEIMVTDLRNFAMPFIRYRIEDVGSPSANLCSCGRRLPLMNIVEGRITDFLSTPEGRLISGAALTVYGITEIPGIKQIQLRQKEVSTVYAYVVKDNGSGPAVLQELTRRLSKYLGPTLKLKVILTDRLSMEKSGKFRYIISDVKPFLSKTSS